MCKNKTFLIPVSRKKLTHKSLVLNIFCFFIAPLISTPFCLSSLSFYSVIMYPWSICSYSRRQGIPCIKTWCCDWKDYRHTELILKEATWKLNWTFDKTQILIMLLDLALINGNFAVAARIDFHPEYVVPPS